MKHEKNYNGRKITKLLIIFFCFLSEAKKEMLKLLVAYAISSMFDSPFPSPTKSVLHRIPAYQNEYTVTKKITSNYLVSVDFLLALVEACSLEGDFDVLGLVQVELTDDRYAA